MRKLSLSTCLALGIGLAAGCGGADSHHGGMLVDPGPVPSNGMQIILPIQKGIKAGTDNELCTWTDVTADRDFLIRAVQGFQSETGHHVILFKTKTYEKPGTTRPCTDDDMASFRFVVAAGGEGITGKNIAPENLVFTVEKGFQIVINEHFLNASTQDHDAQSAINIEFADPKKTYVPSGGVTVLDTKMKVPTGRASLTVQCTIDRTHKVWTGFPHMHRWGTHISVDHVLGATPGAKNRLFDLPWEPKYTFEPPRLVADAKNPIVLNKGDQIVVNCQWNNDTGKVLPFGPEMCLFFGQTIDDMAQGNWQCQNGEWGEF